MECGKVQRNLLNYREGILTPEFRKDIEAHISACGSCKQLLSGMQAVEAIIEKSRSADPDPFIATRIIQHIENELINPKAGYVFELRPVLVTLTALCAIAVGIAIGKSSFDRISGYDENQNQIENLKTELFIHDFIDENKTLLITE